MTLNIDPEFRKLIPPLSADEYAQLEANLLAEGCRDALVAWKHDDTLTLVDGHNRFDICTKHGLAYIVTEREFESREDVLVWMITNQLARRNLTAFSRSELALRMKQEIAAKARINQRGGQGGVLLLQNLAKANTRNEIAAIAETSPETVRKVEIVAAHAPEPIKERARNGDISVDRAFRITKALEDAPTVVREIVAEKTPAEPEVIPILTRLYENKRETFDVIAATGALDGEIPLEQVTVRDMEHHLERAAHEHRQQALEEKRTSKAQEIARIAEQSKALDPAQLGKFPIILADPPWQYEHIETENRAIENHYPTMQLSDIAALPIAQLSADDAVMFLWATSPKLFEAMSVLHCWGFTYRTCMVWVKDKIGMGYYARQRHELLLIGTRGNLPTPLPSNRPDSVITAPRGKHSEKPVEAYELIEKMYPEYRKIELFSRSVREGWHGWGNQYDDNSTRLSEVA